MAPRKNNRKQRLAGEPDPNTRVGHTIGGVVIAVYPNDYACKVRTDDNTEHVVAVPGLEQDSEGSGGCVHIPRLGQKVDLKFGSGQRPYITGFVPVSVDANTSENSTPPIFSKTTDLNTYGNSPVHFRGKMPGGLSPGDWCRVGNQGQHIGLFDEGVVSLYGSPWAQVNAVGNDQDTLNVLGRRMRISSDFGDIEFGSEAGKSYAKLEAGTDQSLESGVDKQNWTVLGNIGQGDNLADFSLLDRTGEDLFRTSVSNDGSIDRYNAGNVTDHIGGLTSVIQDQQASRRVSNGHDYVYVDNGNRIETYLGNQTTQVSKTRSTSILTNDSKIVSGNEFVSCKTQDLQITGRPEAIPTDTAASWKIANGDLAIEIGSPLSGDLQKSLSSFKLTVFPPGSEINLNALLGSIRTFSGVDTSITSLVNMSLASGAMFNASSVGLMSLDSKATMQMSSIGPMISESKTLMQLDAELIQLGAAAAVQPVVRGANFATAFATFLGTVAAASSVAGPKYGNAAAIRIIGAAASVLSAQLAPMLSTKVLTV